jgi:hypothetical protein
MDPLTYKMFNIYFSIQYGTVTSQEKKEEKKGQVKIKFQTYIP